MQKLTLLGAALVALGFAGGGGGFAAMAWSGEELQTYSWKPMKGDSRPRDRTEVIERELDPEMNPLAMMFTFGGGGVVAARVLDSEGEVVFERDPGDGTEGSSAVFVSPIRVVAAGLHRIECTIPARVTVNADLRRNAIIPSDAWMFGCVGSAMAGLLLVAIATVRSQRARIAHATSARRIADEVVL